MKAACILDYFFLDVHKSFWKVASFKTRSVFCKITRTGKLK